MGKKKVKNTVAVPVDTEQSTQQWLLGVLLLLGVEVPDPENNVHGWAVDLKEVRIEAMSERSYYSFRNKFSRMTGIKISTRSGPSYRKFIRKVMVRDIVGERDHRNGTLDKDDFTKKLAEVKEIVNQGKEHYDQVNAAAKARKKVQDEVLAAVGHKAGDFSLPPGVSSLHMSSADYGEVRFHGTKDQIIALVKLHQSMKKENSNDAAS